MRRSAGLLSHPHTAARSISGRSPTLLTPFFSRPTFATSLLRNGGRLWPCTAQESRRSLVSASVITRQAKKEKIIDAEPVQPNKHQKSEPIREDVGSRLDNQFDVLYEKIFEKKRPPKDVRDNALDPFQQTWSQRFGAFALSNLGTLTLLTFLLSLFIQALREQGEHKEYKRRTTAQLEDTQHALRQHRTLQSEVVQRAVDARRRELEEALDTEAGLAVDDKDQVRRLVARTLADLTADINAQLAVGGPVLEDLPPSGGETTRQVVSSGYHKVV